MGSSLNVVCLFPPPELRCPADWRYINSKCYFLSTEKRTWENSRKYCQSKGADLVVIESEQEQVCVCVCVFYSWCSGRTFKVIVIYHFTQQRALYRLDGDAELLFWIGLHDTSGDFKWVDGSALNKP